MIKGELAKGTYLVLHDMLDAASTYVLLFVISSLHPLETAVCSGGMMRNSKTSK